MPLLSESDIEERLAQSSWRREESSIVRDWTFPDFKRAIEFVDLVAAAAESQNHHPDILVHSWNQVRLTLSTHSQGGLTDSDFQMAERIDRLQ